METVKVWTTQEGYRQITENKRPEKYWLNKPTIANSIELNLSIELVESWKKSPAKQMLLD